MTDPRTDPGSDPMELLRSHVRSVALLERPHLSADELIASITGESSFAEPGSDFRRDRSNLIPLRSPRRRRWLVATSAIAVVAVGGAGVAAYVGSRPRLATAGVVCRASIDDSSAIVLSPSSDPLATCAELWATGDLPDIDNPQPGSEVPRLAACVGSEETLQVLPLPEFTSCADVGMRDADVSGAAGDPVVELQRELVDRINAGDCRSVAEVEAVASELLQKLGLGRWTIQVQDPDASCAAVAVDPARSRLVVFANPSSPQDQETP